MTNRCKNTITIIGLQGAPGNFVRALSKVMFQIDLDAMDPAMWGEDPSIDGKSWYSRLVEEYQQEGVYAARYGVPYPQKPYERLGVTAPRFYIETKWEPPFDEILKAQRFFKKIDFHRLLADFTFQLTDPIGIQFGLGLRTLARKRQFALRSPLASPRLQPLRTELIHASHLRHTFSGVDLAHRSQLQFTGILLSGHQHCSPPFNVAGPLIACLIFGVHSSHHCHLRQPVLRLPFSELDNWDEL